MRLLSRILLAFLLMGFFAPGDAPAADTHPSGPTRIRVGVYNNPPKVFLDGDGEVVGIFPDIIADIAEQEGWQVDFVYGNWQEDLRRLENGSLDVMVDMAFSPDRLKRYRFNEETVLLNWAEVYTRPGVTVSSFLDLKDRVVAVMAGSIHTDGERGIRALLKQFDVTCTYVEVGSYDAVFDLLRQGRADAGVVNRLYGMFHESAQLLNRSPIVFNPSQLKFAFPKESLLAPYLAERIDFHLRALKADPDSIYHQVLAHYLSGSPLAFRRSTQRSGPQLEPRERAWIREHPEIRIGVDPGFAPFEFLTETWGHSGIAAEYLEWIGRSLGLRFKVVESASWNETVEKAKRGEIDLLSCVGITEERKRFFFFSKPYLSFPRIIVTRAGSNIQSPQDLNHQRVGVQANSSHHDFIKENTDLKPILYPSFQEALLALSRGEVDAVVGNLAVATDTIRRLSLSNLTITGHTSQGTSPLAFAVRKDWPMLLQLLNKALAAMPEERRIQIVQRWLPNQTSREQATTTGTPPDLPLNAQEKAFLLQHPVIRIAIDPAYPPFEWFDADGRHQGITTEYLRILEERIGVTLEVQPPRSWSEVMEGARERTIDAVTCVSETPSRKAFLNFTRPYLSFPIVIFTRTDSPFVSGLADLQGNKVSVVRGYAPQEFISKNHPGITLSLVETPLAALEEVSTGKTSACVENLAVSTYLMQHHQITNLKVAAPAELAGSTNFAMGVRKDWPLLASILDKALSSITPQERNAIAGKWLTVRFEHEVDWSLVIRYAVGLSGVALLIFAAFLHWNRKLAHEIAERRKIEAELETARDEAEEASRAKSRFLANMSHEIRTPMNAILGYSQLMQKDGTLSAEQKKNLATIRYSGEHLLNLINDILDMSKIEAGRIEIQAVAFELHTMLNELRRLFKERAESKGLALRFGHDPAVPAHVRADEKKLRQILINLLGNAVKFTDEGEVSLHVGVETRREGASGDSPDAVLLRFEVADTGAGIPEDELDSIFQHFEQTEVGRSKEGSGLGLAITRKYLELMDGGIGVESTVGVGSRFTFTLPVTVAGRAEVPATRPVSRVIGLKPESIPCRVLVVDDKATNRELLARVLERVGFTVREAEDGAHAVELFGIWHPRVVMMDIRMPVMDGVEATRLIKASPEGEKTVVIAVSASALEEQRIGVLEKGADAFIRKPFKEDEVFEAIRAHLGVEFLCEEEVPEPEASADASFPEASASLPEPLVRRMRAAAEGGYIEVLNACIDEAGELDRSLARRLRSLADEYDYERLLALLDATESKDAPGQVPPETEGDRAEDPKHPIAGLTNHDIER